MGRTPNPHQDPPTHANGQQWGTTNLGTNSAAAIFLPQVATTFKGLEAWGRGSLIRDWNNPGKTEAWRWRHAFTTHKPPPPLAPKVPLEFFFGVPPRPSVSKPPRPTKTSGVGTNEFYEKTKFPWAICCAQPPPPPHNMGNSLSRPGVVKQDKSSGGSVDTTKTRWDPRRVRMSGGERPRGAAKGNQSDTEALCQPPPNNNNTLQLMRRASF